MLGILKDCGRVGTENSRLNRPLGLSMHPTDSLPSLVLSCVETGDASAELLADFMRHVAKVCRPYPAAYFVLNDKSNESVDDLGHRAFTVCATVEKGRFPFQARTPFRAYVEEQFDGRTIRYHSFYAKISITRELMRDDYARNVRRDPVLRWRAELYADIGSVLKNIAEAITQGRGVPPRWQLSGTGLRMMQPLEVVEARMRGAEDKSVEALVRMALTQAGALSQSRLTNLLEAVLDVPSTVEPESIPNQSDPAERMDIRGAVSQAWDALDDLDHRLIIALARGDSYQDLIAADPRLSHKVAVSRAVNRVGQLFLQQVIDRIGGESSPSATPRSLMEPIIAVLVDLYPDEFAEKGS